jgi:hypothetical protein
MTSFAFRSLFNKSKKPAALRVGKLAFQPGTGFFATFTRLILAPNRN